MDRWEERSLLAPFTARLREAGCVFAQEEARLLLRDAASRELADGMLRRRLEGEPLEHVLGWAVFCGIRLRVAPGVFVPRRRTEFLAAAALDVASSLPAPVVLDLCCGSGAISAVLAAGCRPAELYAADLAPAAVACARRNLRDRVTVCQGDLFAALPAQLRGRIGVVVANAPYVPSDQLAFLPREARAHEPAAALDGGADGLAVLRRIVAQAPDWLAPRGHLLVECSSEQAPQLAPDFAAAGFRYRIQSDDDAEATLLSGIRGPEPAGDASPARSRRSSA